MMFMQHINPKFEDNNTIDSTPYTFPYKPMLISANGGILLLIGLN